MRVFPVLDIMDCGCSMLQILNPINHVRWARNVTAVLRGKRRPVDPATLLPDELVTR